jgi:SAM-dependent methyltransferase
MKLGLKAKTLDALDSVYLRVMARPDLPPYTLRCHVGPAIEYEQLPAEYIAYFKLLCEVRMSDAILDVGCGTGRFASQLLGRPNFFQGTYRGFDIDSRAVEWARAHVTSREANLRFDRVDLFNEHYNPAGTTRAEDFVFPYDDASFDFAFAMSVFTHLPTETTANYLRQIGRVLRPGARAIVSFVLLDENATHLVAPALERLYDGVLVANGLGPTGERGRVHALDGYATLTPDRPAIVTFYDERRVRKMIQAAGLDVEAIHYGSWSRVDGGPAFQDLIVLRRPSDRPA